MPEEIRIYFEGDSSLKPGFAELFKEIIDAGKAKHCRVRPIATGGKPERDFAIAGRKHLAAWNIFLRDSEGPLKPTDQTDSTFWMVEMMEAWFYADKDALARYYKQGFRIGALKANPRVEEISKQDLLSGLNDATRDTTKGRYHKTKHAPKLLELIDPGRVRRAAPTARDCSGPFSRGLRPLMREDEPDQQHAAGAQQPGDARLHRRPVKPCGRAGRIFAERLQKPALQARR